MLFSLILTLCAASNCDVYPQERHLTRAQCQAQVVKHIRVEFIHEGKVYSHKLSCVQER